MAAIGFPVFEGGMTLTKDDLNMLREFLDVQDSVLGRLVGFGIACGLEGSTKGATIRIEAGLAIDQNGRGLVVDEPVTLGPGASANAKFSFVDPKARGVTPVLVFREVEQSAPECGDDSCEPHAPLRLRSAEIVLAEGRLVTGLASFATEPLLDEAPLTVSTKGEVVGDLPKLRDTIIKRLAAEKIALSTAAAERLAGLTLSGVAAVKVYRAAFLNEVLFATIELLRCRALSSGDCIRDEPTPGVALGWLTPTGSWDCRYSHAFLPNEGLSATLLGGSCGNPCDLARERLEAILNGYVEPATPPSGGTGPKPKPPDFDLCPPISRYGPYVFDVCKMHVIPEQKFDPKWLKDYWLEERDPRAPKYDLPRPAELFGDPLDTFKAGTYGLLPTFGADAEASRETLVQVLGQHLAQPDVRVLTANEAAALDGFQPEVNIAVGDTVVLVKDSKNRVVTTGRVSAQHTLRNVGATVQTAQAVAHEAASAIANLQDEVAGTVATQLAGVQAQMSATVSQQVTAQLGSLADQVKQFAALSSKVTALEKELVGFRDYGTRVTQLERDLVAFRDVDTRVTDLRSQLETTKTSVQNVINQQQAVATRVDQVVLASSRAGTAVPVMPAAGVEEVGTTELLAVIGSLQEAVSAAATTKQAPAVAEKLAATEEAVRVMEASATPVRMTNDQRTALVGVMESLAGAAEKAGAPKTELANVRLNLQNLKRPQL